MIGAAASMSSAKPSVLWVGKAPVNGGGDEIYDRRVIQNLSDRAEINRFEMQPQGLGSRLAALARGIPHPRYKYVGRSVQRHFNAVAAQHDHVVISWESFDSLLWTAPRGTTLIVHNVMSDVLGQLYGGHPLLRWAGIQSGQWERRTYRLPGHRLVALSMRDRDLLREIAPGAEVTLAPPGMPPCVPLASDRVIPEIVLSGSYDWAPKRRDLLVIAAEVGRGGHEGPLPGWRHDLPLPDVSGAAPLSAVSRLITASDYADGLRFGLIPDSFVGGFKLKATYYIASNCVLLARCDIRSEFAGLPHAEEFVHFTPDLTDVVRVTRQIAASAGPELFSRWRVFQAACAAKFSWQHCAEAIAATFNIHEPMARTAP